MNSVAEAMWECQGAEIAVPRPVCDAASEAEVVTRVEVSLSHHRQREAGMQTSEGKGLGNFGQVW